jgi:hypothetical protein
MAQGAGAIPRLAFGMLPSFWSFHEHSFLPAAIKQNHQRP